MDLQKNECKFENLLNDEVAILRINYFEFPNKIIDTPKWFIFYTKQKYKKYYHLRLVL